MYMGADAVMSALSPGLAAVALASGFLARTQGDLERIPRTVLELPDNTGEDHNELLLMPADGPEGVGLKLVTIVPGNAIRGLPLIQGLYVLLTPEGLAPELLIDGAALTRLRTAAVSVLATRHLARPDSGRLVVFGAGVQATAHVEAMRSLLPIEHVTIVGRSLASAAAISLVEALRADGIEAVVGTPGAVAQADVICTCTTSTAPVFDDNDLPAGVHVNAIGAYRLEMAELPAASLARALLVVESAAATLAEAGDVVSAIAAGALPPKGFARELREVVAGEVGRTREEQVTIFKSVGLSAEDLIVARALANAIAGDDRGEY
jgi:ornithine cyclodeaminase/alanine dehydrogenase-like protein (mu-crystallin family)